MAKEKFERLLYVGPVSSLSILAASTPGEDQVAPPDARPLITGTTYDDLPPDHPVVMNLKADQLLVPAPDEATEASPDAAVSDSPSDNPGDDRSAKPSDRKPARKPKSEGKTQ